MVGDPCSKLLILFWCITIFFFFRWRCLTFIKGVTYRSPPTPDLSECRSVWLSSLEGRLHQGDSIISIANDLSQVTLLLSNTNLFNLINILVDNIINYLMFFHVLFIVKMKVL